ncbi:hypothetical protein Acy02nite_47410 [Actinoplanes cyaneus]|uniref:Uncharacterized protein n=1 Tax=Actinoplanes cyaneus TaxID=52696 RepID=A0A919M246_9ACTN|nr:hypothetical protein Acy02nite_47410 [Actinoplanes cyaneus]
MRSSNLDGGSGLSDGQAGILGDVALAAVSFGLFTLPVLIKDSGHSPTAAIIALGVAATGRRSAKGRAGTGAAHWGSGRTGAGTRTCRC